MESYQRETERRLSRLEENDDKIFDSLDEIKNTQHSQNLINQKMDFTLDSINREREIDKETNKKNIREMKMYVIGLVGTIVGSLIIAILRTFFGI
ncbi:DUF2951 family protein [Staphylococcus chromogenes]|uniref:DUF2951 family protein n=1 Tax=Staphylococcus chromogenes TaxID=46126 RepID=UPI000D1B5932|nr:DUF2951 family protein [Staphylococcus chromogenes]PTG34045.1 hypothetical protein BU634_04865 [Staphylococcus chromogenes]